MTRSERNFIELDDHGDPRFVPSFIEHYRPLTGICTACLCPCEDHWERLAGDAVGHRGCTYALLQEVTRLRAALAARS